MCWHSLLDWCNLRWFWFKPHQYAALHINPLPSPPFTTLPPFPTLPFRLSPKLFNIHPWSFHLCDFYLTLLTKMKTKARQALLMAVSSLQFFSLQAFLCQFRQLHISRLLVDLEPKRIFNTSKVLVSHLFLLTGDLCRSENTLLQPWKAGKLHSWKLFSIFPLNKSSGWFFWDAHFLFCAPNKWLWFLKSFM